MHKSQVNNLISIALIAFLFITASSRGLTVATPDRRQSAAEKLDLHQALLDLSNPWTVMCVAAHPDDEDGATLTVLRRKYGVHTVSLFTTFGEGGQNAIGPELYEELGAIRAQETLKAAEIQGSEPHFLGLKDFGFSKSAEEAFRIWGHDEALRRMVLEIRQLRPDVIITNHDTTSGHGHHQATGRLVLEAFDAAADPNKFPEQLKTEKVWQVQRLFVRMPTERGANKAASDADAAQIVSIDRNERDPDRGTTYAEQALRALRQHATQGPWPQSLPKDGLPPIRYRLVRQANGSAPITTNPKTFLDGLQMLGEVDSSIRLEALDMNSLTPFPGRPDELFKMIAMSRESSGSSESWAKIDAARARLMDNRSAAALAALSGITATLRSVDPTLVPNSDAHVVITISNNGTRGTTIQAITIDGVKQATNLRLPKLLEPGSTESVNATISISRDEPITDPRAEHLYDGRIFGKEFKGVIRIEVGGRVFPIPVSTSVGIAPAVEIASISPSPLFTTNDNVNRPLTFAVRLVNNQRKPFKGQFGVASKVLGIDRTADDIALAANETREFMIRTNVVPMSAPPNRADFDSIIISVRPLGGAAAISQKKTRVVYGDAHVKPGLRVGFVRSFDDTLADALASLGVESQELSIHEIRSGDLQKFNTIIIDNRGYQAHPELIDLNPRLLDFAKNGGTLIVFYQKSNEWNEDSAKNRPSLAPYPIVLGDDRVTDETAPVTFIDPEHLLLNSPNKIIAEDFAGWIQERGLYYPKSWDARYKTVFVMNDVGEAPLSGGLLIADYGRGRYIYTSMVWYRQLRAGVPGGYRMFANMISYGHRETVPPTSRASVQERFLSSQQPAFAFRH